jgi:voltage-gated potassium channel Kch
VEALATNGQGLVVAGREGGQVQILRVINYPLGLPITTAVRLWQSAAGAWDDRFTALCPLCGERFAVSDDMLGQDVDCLLCQAELRLNPFVCDFRE